jgi:hypothetical protein
MFIYMTDALDPPPIKSYAPKGFGDKCKQQPKKLEAKFPPLTAPDPNDKRA